MAFLSKIIQQVKSQSSLHSTTCFLVVTCIIPFTIIKIIYQKECILFNSIFEWIHSMNEWISNASNYNRSFISPQSGARLLDESPDKFKSLNKRSKFDAHLLTAWLFPVPGVPITKIQPFLLLSTVLKLLSAFIDKNHCNQQCILVF